MLLDLITDRSLVIGLAIAGAVLATLGSVMKNRGAGRASYAQMAIRAGYVLAWTSVALFIVAGFRA